MPRKPDIEPGDWMALANELLKNTHVQAQVERIMGPLRIIQGAREVSSFDDVLRNVCQQMAILILDESVEACANTGGIQVVRSTKGVGGGGYPDNYAILLHSAEVYGFQMWGADEVEDMKKEQG